MPSPVVLTMRPCARQCPDRSVRGDATSGARGCQPHPTPSAGCIPRHRRLEWPRAGARPALRSKFPRRGAPRKPGSPGDSISLTLLLRRKPINRAAGRLGPSAVVALTRARLQIGGSTYISQWPLPSRADLSWYGHDGPQWVRLQRFDPGRAKVRYRVGFRMPAGRERLNRGRGRRSLIAPRLARAKFLSSAWGPFLRPGLRIGVRRAQGRSRLAAGHRRRRRGLDGSEHGATLDQTGIYATSCRGHGSFRGLPCCRSAATWHRGGRHRYVRNAINFVRSVATPAARLPSLVPTGTRFRLVLGETGELL
jgi:hypothetical protein